MRFLVLFRYYLVPITEIFDFKKNDPQFMKKIVEKMESFLTSIQNSEINLGDDVIKYLEENREVWLQSFFDANDWAEIW